MGLDRLLGGVIKRKLPELALQIKELDRQARQKEKLYLVESKALVRTNRRRKWETYVHQSTRDCYSAGSLEASLRVMKSLSEGKTVEDSLHSFEGLDLTYFMAGSVGEAVSYFHPRGEEFKVYWNRQYPSLKVD